jgi:outer membrane lipoprotein carrier protein
MLHRYILALPLVLLVACGGAETAESRASAASEGERPEVPATVPGGEAALDPNAPVSSDGSVADPAPGAERPAAAPGAGQGSPGSPGQVAPGSYGVDVQRPSPTGEADPQAVTILRRVQQTYANIRSMEADFVQHLTVPLLGTEQRSVGRLANRRPDRLSMRFSDPQGDVLVADGRHLWIYSPSTDRTQVIRSAMGAGGAQVDFQRELTEDPTARYVATLIGTATVGGRQTHVISLVPRGRSPYRLIRVWVDQQDSIIRRFEMTEENDTVRRIELSNVRINPNLPDSTFQFTPPAGAQIFDQ